MATADVRSDRGRAQPPAGALGDQAARRAHIERRARLVDQIRSATAPPRLDKEISNLFRERERVAAARIDTRAFRHVLAVDPQGGTVEVEGMCPYGELVDATLPHGVVPAVVPELKGITIGGALAGVGIESSSFRFGLVHETILEFDVVTGSGEVVTARPEGEHAELFFGFPNSYGTLGYAVRILAKTVPVKPYVRLEHRKFRDPDAFYAALEAACADASADFVEGEIFARDLMVVSIGRFVDTAPYTSDYTFEKIYYKSILERDEDFLTVRDYIWRWDTDWFWCSKNLGMEIPLLRRIMGKERLNSMTYTRIMRAFARSGLGRIYDLLGYRSESVIQDVVVPFARAPEFLAWFHDTIGILPIWNCPVRALRPEGFSLFRLEPGRLYVNFGFWQPVRRREAKPDGWYNRQIEKKVAELGGVKSLYSDSYYPPDEFWQRYDAQAYDRLKRRYDPERRLRDLYEKCVLKL
ncbi:MAG: FAD-binding oxidoreductase [Geminicoccaceae bacterium]|nr:FAD-binding oxidoreductase [Geminicoccaceae bacterium]MCX7628656.1 FAD-binding oxidoreductase [Geminicoccaceae bacterium]MDW8123761.1 FAD-binding oxidoreductase [Geminicoccaceae bacterium]